MVLQRKSEEGERVSDAGVEDRHRLGQRVCKARTNVRDRSLCAFHRNLREDRFHSGGKLELTALWDVREHVAEEVHLAALPARAGHHRTDRGL